MSNRNDKHEAFRLTITDPAACAYLQRYPFAAGPDKAMNAQCLQMVEDNLTARTYSQPATVVRLRPEETYLGKEHLLRLERIMDEAGVEAKDRQHLIDDFAWEANLVPRSAENVLVLGCGDGVELMFLRAVLPNAKITALDYNDQIPASRKQATAVHFFQGDFHTILAALPRNFDLISSNHTLEHLYTPEETLALLATLLVCDGYLISTLPMDAKRGSPFLSKVAKAAHQKSVHLLDFVYLDAGHGWKTNPSDLDATLQQVGFDQPKLYQRAEHLSRTVRGTEKRFKAEMRLGIILHTICFAFPRAVAKMLPREVLGPFSKILLAAERRVWFGSNQLKNRYSEEVLVLARKNSGSDKDM